MGRAWLFGDDVSTDDIIPGVYSISVDPEEAATHAFAYERPEFAKTVKSGDIVVAGNNFGCGSSRESAVLALKGSGVKAVIASSFAFIFFRNAINNGLLVVRPRERLQVDDGDEVEFDEKRMVLINRSTDRTFELERPRRFLLEIAEEGGLIAYLNKNRGYKV